MSKRNIILLGICVVIGVSLSVFLKFELFWDFINYHYYNGYAFLNNRLGKDVAPASLNTFLNPLLDTLTYVLVTILNDFPNLYYAVTGLFFAMILYVLALINFQFFDEESAGGKTCVFFSLVLATTGFATYSQIGTSTNEMPVALLVLTGLYLLMKNLFSSMNTVNFLLSAFLLGSAAGLKMTAAIYCIASGVCLIVFYRKIPNAFKKIAEYAVAGFAGFCATNGFWMFILYKHFDNPFFPFGNAVFKSAYFDEINYSYRVIFQDRTFLEAMLVPLKIAGHWLPSYLGNAVFSDIRWLLAVVLLTGSLFYLRKHAFSDKTRFLIVFTLSSYILWLFCFSVVRYLIPVETLLPVFFVKTALFFKPEGENFIKKGFYTATFLLLFFMCCSTVFLSEPWGSRRGWDHLFSPLQLNFPEKTVFVTHNAPNSAYMANLAKKTPMIIVNKNDDIGLEKAYWDFTTRGMFHKKINDLIENADSVAYWFSFHENETVPIIPEGYKCRKWITASPVDTMSYMGREAHLICFSADVFDNAFKK